MQLALDYDSRPPFGGIKWEQVRTVARLLSACEGGSMKVLGVVWAATRTNKYAETYSFFKNVLGVPLEELEPDFGWSRLPDSSQFEMFGPSDTKHRHFSTGPVPEFLVDDVVAAHDELRAAGVEILGEPHLEGTNGWLHFRAPDGNVYGVTAAPTYVRPRQPDAGRLDRETERTPASDRRSRDGIRVLGVVWAGTRTDKYAETYAFFLDALGVPLTQRAPDVAWGRMPDSSLLEIFGPTETEHRHFSTGPVPEFLVDDVVAALDELRAAGVQILGEPHLEGTNGWLHFRAPDGNVYGVTAGPDYFRPLPPD